MASILIDLGIVEEALMDLAAFAAGKPISAKISGYDATVIHLPNGPEAPYLTISGGFFAILLAVLSLAGTFAAGADVHIAAKEGNTWYGITLSHPALAAVTQLSEAAGNAAAAPNAET